MRYDEQLSLADIDLESRNSVLDKTHAAELFSTVVDYLIGEGVGLTESVRTSISDAHPIMGRLLQNMPRGSQTYYARSVIAFIDGDFGRYLTELDLFFHALKKPPDWIAFEKYIWKIVTWVPTLASDSKEPDLSFLWKEIKKISAQYFPESACTAMCKYLCSDSSSNTYRIRLLQDVLAKDTGWITARSIIGSIYYEQKDWRKALLFYELVLKDLDDPSPEILFNSAWCADQVNDINKAIGYYQLCAQIDPEYDYVNNNLGFDLIKEKRYSEAETYLLKAIDTDANKRYACRNLFDAYEKQGKYSECISLVQEHPEQFQTKYYKERVRKRLSQTDIVNPNTVDWESLLQRKTKNEHAGSISVVSEGSGIRLYQHQKDAIRRLSAWYKRDSSGAGLLVLPTGGGKTLTSTYWLMQDVLDRGGKVLWIAHRHELLDQALNSFRRVCYSDLSPHKSVYQYRIVSGQHDKSVHIRPEDDILIASKSSLAHNLSYIQNNWIKENKNRICIIIDEAHHAAASEYRKLIKALENNGGDFHMLGLTATPFRTAEKERGLLKKMFRDDILYKIDLRTLIEREILADPIFHPIKTDVNMDELFHAGNADEILQRIVNEHGFDFDSPGSVGEKAAKLIAEHSERNRLIVKTYTDNQSLYGKTLVFAVNIDMALTLNALFLDSGVRSDYIVSSVKDAITKVSRSAEDNREAIRRFREGDLDVLVNVNILTEGTDLPEVQTVFLTRPTKSTILMTQMIGRALRGKEAGGTALAYIVSFLDDWQEYIAWVNPEKLFIDTNADFGEHTSESRKYAARLVSIAKIEEFARLANDTLDDRITEGFSFLERIPIGFYQFSYLPDGEEESKNCTVLVYDCMENAYQDLMRWLASQSVSDLPDLEAVVNHIDETLFCERDRLLGYHKNDIRDILAYYQQTEVLPQWVLLEERTQYDVAAIAQNIIDHKYSRVEEDEYITSEWERADGRWSAFFGYHNLNAFNAAIDQECRRILHPERYQPPKEKPITNHEEMQIQDLPLIEIRRRYPDLYEKLHDAVFAKYQDSDGFYFSAQSGYRSTSKLDFQIDHIMPMARGGLTTLDNLQLLTVYENALKRDT